MLFTHTAGGGIDFFSFTFLALCLPAVLGMRLACRQGARTCWLLAFNLVFFSTWLDDFFSICMVAFTLALTWLMAKAKILFSQLSWPTVLVPVCVVGLWLLIFMGKEPNLLAPINPFHYQPMRIVGFSYIVLRCISYIMDAQFFKTHNPLTLINYTLFFPSLAAGPIERFDTFQPFHDEGGEPLGLDGILAAFHRIATGYVKKYVLADNLMAITAYSGEPLGAAWAWLLFLLPLFVLYLDFSGYTDIAVGVALLMGLKMRENFNRPFWAANVQEFWNRWHMSLSYWVRDYFFTPLLMTALRWKALARHGFWASMVILGLTMMLLALWHGTGWCWVAFGLVQGLALMLFQAYKKWMKHRLPAHLRAFLYDSWAGPWVGRTAVYLFMAAANNLWWYKPSAGFALFKEMFGI